MSVYALDLITAAFGNLNVFQTGATIPAPMAQDGFLRLNRMIGMWAIQTYTIPSIERHAFPLVANKGGPALPYTIGTGGDFNIPRPPSQGHITNVALILGGTSPAVETARAYYTDDGYAAIVIKTLPNALFTGVYYDPTSSGAFGEIFLWPVPDNALHQVVLYHEAPLAAFADLNVTAYTLPPGYEEAIIYNLERRLATPYGRALPADDKLLADTGMRLIKRNNVNLIDMPNDFARDRRGGYDINVGGSHFGGN